MTLSLAAFLVGLFGVPATLLWLGHRLRKRSPLVLGLFWGAVVGYGAAVLAVLVAGFCPMEAWTSQEVLRGLVGYWSLLVLPVVGGLLGAVRAWRA